jgi:flagellar motor switch protein FliM
MGKTKSPPERVIGGQPRHALEAADACGQRTVAAVRRVAGRIAAALSASLGVAGDSAALHFAVAGYASGRRDQFDDVFVDGADIAAIAIEPVHAPALLIADHVLSAVQVERHFGGRAEAPSAVRGRRKGIAEAREFAQLADTLAAALQQSCDDRVPVVAARLGTMAAEDALDLLAPGEAVARIDFTVTVPSIEADFGVTLLLPLAALRAASVLQMALATRDLESRNRWKANLARRAGDIAMPARSVIARPLLSMQQLMALRPGDVIPIGMPRRVPLLVADRRIATGTIGERDGRVAFMIDHLEREETQ